MFGLSFEKLLIIGVLAIFIVGPERLPVYAGHFARLVRNLRDMARGAGERAKEELGPEFSDVDWKKLDPRQYDPRRIIREALLEDESQPRANSSADVNRAGQPAAGANTSSDQARVSEKVPAAQGIAHTPFDSEAT